MCCHGPQYVLRVTLICQLICLVVHPYYKLDYIESQWGGNKEQEEERAAGNSDAKDWVYEARKIVESTVRIFYPTFTCTN